MNYKAILFDLDGTLLPMNMETFTKGYFEELSKVMAPLLVNPKDLVSLIWAGTEAMVRNDGSKRNEEVFWEKFFSMADVDKEQAMQVTESFYKNEFHNAKRFAGENKLATEVVALAHAHDRKVVLATNPLFPMNGQLSRISWVGLKEEDFEFITSYETECYCKPNPDYYKSICERLGVKPEECLMIGNDEKEDMYAASSIGMDCYLVTDCIIPCEEHPWKGASGSFASLLEVLK